MVAYFSLLIVSSLIFPDFPFWDLFTFEKSFIDRIPFDLGYLIESYRGARQRLLAQTVC